jgi:hypothetical protein
VLALLALVGLGLAPTLKVPDFGLFELSIQTAMAPGNRMETLHQQWGHACTLQNVVLDRYQILEDMASHMAALQRPWSLHPQIYEDDVGGIACSDWQQVIQAVERTLTASVNKNNVVPKVAGLGSALNLSFDSRIICILYTLFIYFQTTPP